ncbi:MAG: hypothetical protein NC189_00310 [Bacteroides sp.]|nr:hypothetical protein [Bacteroides sp.]
MQNDDNSYCGFPIVPFEGTACVNKIKAPGMKWTRFGAIIIALLTFVNVIVTFTDKTHYITAFISLMSVYIMICMFVRLANAMSAKNMWFPKKCLIATGSLMVLSSLLNSAKLIFASNIVAIISCIVDLTTAVFIIISGKEFKRDYCGNLGRFGKAMIIIGVLMLISAISSAISALYSPVNYSRLEGIYGHQHINISEVIIYATAFALVYYVALWPLRIMAKMMSDHDEPTVEESEEIVNNPNKHNISWAAVILTFASGLILLLAMICIDLFTKGSSNKQIDDSYPEVEEIVLDYDYEEDEDEPIKYEEPETYSYGEFSKLEGRYQINGIISKHPYTMEVSISPDGNISGTFWNILYNIKLPVSGTMGPDGTINATMGKGSTESHLTLNRESDFTFTGTWGKKLRRVTAEFTPAENNSSTVHDPNAIRLRVKGEGINAIAHLGNYFRYESQGNKLSNALRAYTDDGLNFTIYDKSGNRLAGITLEPSLDGLVGEMVDVSDCRFKLREEDL